MLRSGFRPGIRWFSHYPPLNRGLFVRMGRALERPRGDLQRQDRLRPGGPDRDRLLPSRRGTAAGGRDRPTPGHSRALPRADARFPAPGRIPSRYPRPAGGLSPGPAARRDHRGGRCGLPRWRQRQRSPGRPGDPRILPAGLPGGRPGTPAPGSAGRQNPGGPAARAGSARHVRGDVLHLGVGLRDRTPPW